MPDTPESPASATPASPGRWRRGDWRHRGLQIYLGIFLMFAGMVLTVDRLGLLATTGIARFWPVLVIAPGVALLFSRADSRGRFWGAFWAILGSWLLLRSLGIITIGLGDLLGPLLLVFIGVKLVTRTSGFRLPFGVHNSSDPAQLFAVMSEAKRINNDNPFKGMQISAFMGGCQLDLRLATIPPGEAAVIDVFSMMGGTEIWVPASWTVESQIAPIMGSVDDKRLPAMPSPVGAVEAPRRLLLRGTVIMSGLTIKN
jgi:predicted membrane protein